MHVNPDECEAAGVDKKEIERIARGISRYAKQAEKLGVEIFGGTGGELRFSDSRTIGPLKLAGLDGSYDGGCGADHDWGDGFLRGE